MTDQPLAEVLRVLARLKIEHMLTGSYASNIYGKVRSTFDADFVVILNSRGFSKLVQQLEKHFYLDSTSMEEIKEAGDQFNAIHKTSGLKIDFYILKSDAYARTAFSRKQKHTLLGEPVWVIAPEDLILAKLQWAKSGGSQRQVEDAHGIYQLQKNNLDQDYLNRWAKELSISAQLASIH